MALGNWQHTGDYYVSGKFGQNTNDGISTSTPVSTLDKALQLLVDGGTSGKTITIKSGRYLPGTFNWADKFFTVHGEGVVEIDGQGTQQLRGTTQNHTLSGSNLHWKHFDLLYGIEALKSSFFQIDGLFLSGCSYSIIANSNVVLNKRNPAILVDGYKHSNFINSKISLQTQSQFTQCFFDLDCSFKYNGTSNQTFTFKDCRFQKGFLYFGQPLTNSFIQSNLDIFIRCEVIDDPRFNSYNPNEPNTWDFTLQWTADLAQRSKLYLGMGQFAGAFKFAVPVTSSSNAFATVQTTKPYADYLDDEPIWLNLDRNTTTITFIDNSQPGIIRSNGQEGSRLSFGFLKKVDQPYQLVGHIFNPDEFIDTNRTDDRATYKVRIIDPITGNWLPSPTTWYEMQVNAPWQIDNNGKGNGDPDFVWTNAKYLTCQEYQIELTINNLNPLS